MTTAHCSVTTVHAPTTAYHVESRHYEPLRDALDRRETGWVELVLAAHSSGRVLLRLEDITEISLCTTEYLAVRDTERLVEP